MSASLEITMTDWIQLWNDLARGNARRDLPAKTSDDDDRWQKRAHHFDTNVRRRLAKPDSTRAFLISLLQAMPDSTLLDIGAGTGKWAVVLAPYAKRVTAVEPSPAMLEKMQRNLAEAQIGNVEIVPAAWPDVAVEQHDVTLCSHAMYAMPDFVQFIHSLEAVTRHTCALLMRAPMMDGVMAEAARHIWGHPYDSPNYQIALNALLQMGLFPNVLMEEPGTWEPWSHNSLADALAEIKRRFGLSDNTEHDEFLQDLLRRRLTLQDGVYVWPRAMQTALVFWRVQADAPPHLDYRAAVREDAP